MRRGVAFLTIVAFLSGCAAPSERVAPSYVSPVSYSRMSCAEIGLELEAIAAEVARIGDKQDQAATRDAVAVGVGVLIFWPALFLLAGGDYEERLSRYKGEYQALKRAEKMNRCASAEFVAQAPGRTDGTLMIPNAALPAGPVPYEGVDPASLTAVQRDAYCTLSWRRAVESETGRTVYNPCRS